ncbi:hypothetical protein D3C71_1992650 [compost metagenome]
MRQSVEAVVDHRQGVAQVFLATRTSRQVGEVGRDTRVFGGLVMFVETNALDGKLEICAGHDLRSHSTIYTL